MDDGFELIGASGQVIDLAHLESEVTSPRWAVRYPAGQAFEALDDNILKQLLRTGVGEWSAGFVINLALSSQDFVSIWENPYFNENQKLVQTGITSLGAGVSSLAGMIAGGMVTGTLPTFVVVAATGVAVYWSWENIVKPAVSWITVNIFERTDPYQINRSLSPLTGN